jgi:hypothetical protein
VGSGLGDPDVVNPAQVIATALHGQARGARPPAWRRALWDPNAPIGCGSGPPPASAAWIWSSSTGWGGALESLRVPGARWHGVRSAATAFRERLHPGRFSGSTDWWAATAATPPDVRATLDGRQFEKPAASDSRCLPVSDAAEGFASLRARKVLGKVLVFRAGGSKQLPLRLRIAIGGG